MQRHYVRAKSGGETTLATALGGRLTRATWGVSERPDALALRVRDQWGSTGQAPPVSIGSALPSLGPLFPPLMDRA